MSMEIKLTESMFQIIKQTSQYPTAQLLQMINFHFRIQKLVTKTFK